MRLNVQFAFACVSLIGISAPAFAQSAPADEGASDEDTVIIVQARRRDEAVQDVPLVVNVVSAESIEKLNVRSGTDVQNLVPGLQLRNEANGIGGAGQIRGVQFDPNTSANATVAFYFNDAPIDGGSVLQAMYDIGQVEVLRGPQGTLRGAAAPSGSITFTTHKPNLSEVGLNMTGTVNDLGLTNLNGAINIPVIKDIFGIRIAGLTERSQANRVHSIDSDADLAQAYSNTDSIRLSATLQPADWFKVEGTYQVISRESRSYDQYASFSLVNSTAPASPTLIRPSDFLSIQETARTVEQRFETYNWRGELRFGGQALIYQGSNTKLRFHAIGNQDTANFFDKRDVFQDTNTLSSMTSHEVRLQNEDRLLGSLDYVLGYYHTQQYAPTNLTTQTAVRLPTSFGGGIATIVNTPIFTAGDTRETSFFGNVTVHLGDATEISGGLRHIEFQTPARTITIGANVLPVGGAVDDKKWIYTASIKHNFTPDLMVYASTGTSRRPGPSIVNPGATIRSTRMNSFIQLTPEDSESYEVGLKSAWLDGAVTFNLTGFYQKFDGYPYKISTGVYFQSFNFVNNVPVPAVGNGAQFGASVPVTVKGVEAELGWRVTPNFRLGAIAAYSDGMIKNGVIPCDDIDGNGIPDATTTAPTVAQLQAAYGSNYIGACSVTQRSSKQSPFSATVTADYNVPVSANVDFFARGLFNYYGSSLVEPTNVFDNLGSYGLLNLFAGIRNPDGNWELNFFAKNVFNTIRATQFDPPATTSYQQLNTSFQASGASYTSTYSQIQTNAPREFGISLRVALGSR